MALPVGSRRDFPRVLGGGAAHCGHSPPLTASHLSLTSPTAADGSSPAPSPSPHLQAVPLQPVRGSLPLSRLRVSHISGLPDLFPVKMQLKSFFLLSFKFESCSLYFPAWETLIRLFTLSVATKELLSSRLATCPPPHFIHTQVLRKKKSCCWAGVCSLLLLRGKMLRIWDAAVQRDSLS